MQIILHIGADKCGSTAIQKTLFHNAATLQKRGIAYLAGEFILAHDGTICRNENGERIIDCEKLQERLDIAESRNSEILIFSFEGLHTVSLRSLLEVAEKLKNHETHIVYYIREQADYVNSALLQKAKTNYVAENALRVFRGEWDGFTGHSYAGILFIWRKAFPDSRYSVRIFDRRSLAGGDVVEDFFECIGVSMDGLIRDRHVVNTAITLETAVALESLAALGLVKKDRGSVAIGLGSEMGGCSKLISRSHSWIIRARNLRRNASLGRRYFGTVLPFRFKSMRRDSFDRSRVLEILRENGKVLSHVPVGEDFEMEREKISFIEQGFEFDANGALLKQGENRLLIRCGNWHAAELWNQVTIRFSFSRPSVVKSVALWEKQTEPTEDGTASLTFELAEIAMLIPTTVTFECANETTYLTNISIEFG